MKVTFAGAARTVTGSCYYIDNGKYKFLVDCGAFQGSDKLDKLNREPFPFNPAELDFVLLTHAHYDHCGRLPLLTKQGFQGKIIATKPTKDLTNIVLNDAAYLQKEDFEHFKTKIKRHNNISLSEEGMLYENREPLFSEEDVIDVIDKFECYGYGENIKLNEDIEIRMRDAGHILGSVSFEVWVKNEVGRIRKLVFSGDLGQPGERIIRDPDYIREADYVWIESTYGDRLHKSKDETTLELLSILKQAVNERGNVIMPVFAVERAQEIIYELNLFYEKGLLKNFPVYLDSPMAEKVLQVFLKYPEFYDEDAKMLIAKGDDPFSFDGLLFTHSVEDSKRLANLRGGTIMAGSGMATGGRVTHHLINNLYKKNAHVVFVGYQVKGTLGRRILDGFNPVRIHGINVDVNAEIHSLGGFSAHGDERDLRYWLRSFGHSPVKVFVVHGEEDIAIGFASNIREELRLETYVPRLNETVQLD